jgi:hypothetical protein
MPERIAQASLLSLSRPSEMSTQLMMEDPEGPEVNYCGDKGTGIGDHGNRVVGRRAELNGVSWDELGRIAIEWPLHMCSASSSLRDHGFTKTFVGHRRSLGF